MTAKELYNKIGHYYCVVETNEEAQVLADACKEASPDLIQMSIKVFNQFRYFVILKDEGGYTCYSFVDDNTGEKKKITQKEMLQKITNKETYNLELTNKDVFFLRCLLGGITPREVKEAVAGSAPENNLLRKDLNNNFDGVFGSVLGKVMKVYHNNHITDKNFEKEKTEKFHFSNDEKATWINGQNKIQIGCQTKTRQEILAYEDVFDKVDEIKVEGLTFKAAEGREFIEYLRDR